MNDLFGREPTMAELLERIQALEAVVYQQAKRETVKAEEPLNEAWQVWNRHRSGKGWTAKARELSMKKLRELAGTDGTLAMSIVCQSVERGWTGLFPLKSSSTGAPGTASSPAPVKHKTVTEALARTESREENERAWRAQQAMYGNNQYGSDR